MKYKKQIFNGYIVACGEFQNGVDITGDEYTEILAAFQSRPVDPEGHTYKLSADNLEWELVELPEPVEEDAEISDYENALSDLGVQFND